MARKSVNIMDRKVSVSISLPLGLLEEARSKNINLSSFTEKYLREHIND